MNSWISYVIAQFYKKPSKIAFKSVKESLSYGDFLHLVYRYYLYLKSLNLKDGTPLIIEAKRNYHYFAMYAATVIAKLIFVPLEENIPSIKIQYYLSCFDESYYLKDYININLPDEVDFDSFINSIDISKDDVGQILFTSGSQSEPKGVISNNDFFVYNTLNEVEGYDESMSLLVMAPVNHIGGIANSLSVLMNGGTLLFLDNAFDFNGFFIAFEELGANAIFATASIVKIYLDMGEEEITKLGIKKAYVAGEYCSKELKDRFYRAFHFPLISYYGSTECGLIAVNVSEEDESSLGYIFKGKEILIEDDEILINSPYIFKGYVNKGSTSLPFHSGDIGFIKNGKLYFTGRKDSIINSGGLKINPNEVETVALRNSQVKECLCVGKNDKDFQKIAVLFYTGNILEKELKEYLNANLELYKVPKEIHQIEKFAKNSSGKKDLKYYQKLVNESIN